MPSSRGAQLLWLSKRSHLAFGFLSAVLFSFSSAKPDRLLGSKERKGSASFGFRNDSFEERKWRGKKPHKLRAFDGSQCPCKDASFLCFLSHWEWESKRLQIERQNPFEDEGSAFLKAFSMTTTKVVNENTNLFDASVKRSREGMNHMAQRRMEAPSTPGRPFVSFSLGQITRKNVPSKWDDAEKWLIGSPCHESPAHVKKPTEMSKIYKQNDGVLQKDDAFAENQVRLMEYKVPSLTNTGLDGPCMSAGTNVAFSGASTHVLLKDKFTDNVESTYSNFRFLDPSKEGFLFRSSYLESLKNCTAGVVAEVQVLRRDIGTERTPTGSSSTTRCHTPIKITSPARHNTPADRSGPLVPYNAGIDISELKDCHLAKLDTLVSNWSSREEEEEEVSKSLRHLEISGEKKATTSWEDEERAKLCIRYQREQAKIQAWVNLQNAKAEAQSRKLEVKIQKMRSNLEEKLMKRMTIVHRRAEERRASAQLQHSQQLQRVSEQAYDMKRKQSTPLSGEEACRCFPCNHHHHHP
ncbi:hypothetical protein ZIOFF_003888 [Zingiber officinale]|uniref:Remorin C-terminal domain-containing protein n=1 Tax=Zingiber officinale TaxID=94328 RepID=A0A8J5ING8_ZINOF|nr:hypothetical protein ZIOFF_003888 [Zingiber officinale]